MTQRGLSAPPGVLQSTAAAQRRVAPLMLAAVLSLLIGLWAGLRRIGWDLPAADAELMLRHGGLMVVGFIATAIAVERAVAVRSLPAFAAPALSAAAGVALIAGLPDAVAPALATASAVAYSVNIATLLERYRQPPLAILLAGGLCLAVAGLVWWEAGGLRRVIPWWMAFLVLTIAAERLEIIRFQRFTPAGIISGAIVLALLVVGPVVTFWDVGTGARVLGVGMLAAPVWLVRRDIARHTVRTDGMARFAAVGVLLALAWLAVGGALLVVDGLGGGVVTYDAVIHAFFIGFVFGAIIAHQPIIVPAITGIPARYTPALYVPLAVLDAGLVARVAADIAEDSDVRRWAGMVQAIAIVLFLLLAAGSLVAGRRAEAASSTPATRGPARDSAAGSGAARQGEA